MYVIPEEHVSMLRRLLGIQSEELPLKVQDAYWLFKYAADRITCPMTEPLLIQVAVECHRTGVAKIDAPRRTFMDDVDAGVVKAGTTIMADWRGDMVRAEFIRLGPGRTVIAQIGSTERSVSLDKVSVLQGVTAKESAPCPAPTKS